MSKKMLVNLVKNKRNGQVNLSLPKKAFDMREKKCLEKAKRAWINLEGFE